MIIDSHCHLNYEPMSLSLKETIDRANREGVKLFTYNFNRGQKL